MKFLQIFLIALFAFEHDYFKILEMFLWTKPKGLITFGNTKEAAENSKVLAANQGLYNGFLAAGLFWSIMDNNYGTQLAIFFLSCVVIAGVYGAYSTKKSKLFIIQALPAILALILVLIPL
jgi:putative membrane protein